jgi:DNA-directed RNA polymerase specialized sigma24 family protein
MTLVQASGMLTYTPEISGVIESIAARESNVAARSRIERDDLRQEIRMACIKALSQYDPTRIGPSPFAFLQRCAKNHRYNLSRGTFVPNNPPCVRCPLWSRETRSCSVNEVDCTKIVDYRRNMTAKVSIKHAENLGSHETTDSSDSNQAFALKQSIIDTLPQHLITDFQKMASGLAHEVSSKNKAAIRKFVRSMIQDG